MTAAEVVVALLIGVLQGLKGVVLIFAVVAVGFLVRRIYLRELR